MCTVQPYASNDVSPTNFQQCVLGAAGELIDKAIQTVPITICADTLNSVRLQVYRRLQVLNLPLSVAAGDFQCWPPNVAEQDHPMATLSCFRNLLVVELDVHSLDVVNVLIEL